MPITATIQSVSRAGDGVSVGVQFNDGSAQQFDFNPVPAPLDIRAAVQAEVKRRNTIDNQVTRLQSLVGVVFD